MQKTKRSYSENNIHKLRISIRRLNSLIKLIDIIHPEMGFKGILKPLKRILNSFQNLRDQQVQLLYIENMLPKFPELKVYQKYVSGNIKQELKNVNKNIKQVNVKKLEKKLLKLTESIPEISLNQAIDVAKELFAKVKQYGDAVCTDDIHTIHKLRIAFKNFRYTVELYAPARNISKAVFDQIHSMQNMMGEIQDLEVLTRQLRKFLIRDETLFNAYREIENQKRQKVEQFLDQKHLILNFRRVTRKPRRKIASKSATTPFKTQELPPNTEANTPPLPTKQQSQTDNQTKTTTTSKKQKSQTNTEAKTSTQSTKQQSHPDNEAKTTTLSEKN